VSLGRIPTALSIAGSDSGGGAGIQADLKAFARCGVHGMTAITAVTWQNTVAVTGVTPIPPEGIVGQVRAVAEDIGVDAVKIGMLGSAQTIAAESFPVFRTVDTGSWVAQRYQRQGIGKEMRGAVLAFAFDHLGARLATSEAFTDNTASNAVSGSLGYEPDGFGQLAPEGVARETMRYRMTLERWQSRPRPTVEVEGLERCRALLGIA